MKMERLAPEMIEQKLLAHPDWRLREGKLYRVFLFDSFVGAFGFMTQVALLAEAINHHPEWSNVYNRVEIRLVTHDVDGISARDFDLAEKIDRLL